MVLSVDLRAIEQSLPTGMRCIVPVAHDKDTLLLPQQLSDFASMLTSQDFTGKEGQQYIFNDGKTYLVFVGIGEQGKLLPRHVQRPLGNAVRAHLHKGSELAVLAAHIATGDAYTSYLTELVLSSVLATYSFTKYKSKKNEAKEQTKQILLFLEKPTKEYTATVARALEIAKSIAWTRDIVNEPSNATPPQYLAYLLKSDEKNAPFHVEIFDGKKIQEMGMQLVWAVGKGSSEDPHFAKVTYMGNPANKKFVALVGKGVNFDTGGVQVKPDTYMNTMKGDMGGAALVMGVMHALARLGAEVNVIAYLPFVENSVDGGAFKPDDVYTAFNGKTVEIKHTDAEGRLILADALAYASLEKPTEILDFATLTGAVTVALGPKYAAVMGTNQEAMEKLHMLGEEVGEHVWQLPLEDDYRKFMNSDIADIANVSEKRVAGTIMGGIFLKEFVDASIPWVHMDIAGVATTSKGDGIHSDFATGYGVRLMVEYLTRK
ncbi:leucyl aminopeptidase [Candidatus Gracilibacteria bacterium CG17_big_fil_post_rev_8_21_14_2_50_48_13]|nr:MAG: leucyl aminopeptidase [Candidatus Gracilibacteria bacterium CG17_big_fil_post_rev_8_21_14_2_50_48_13]